VYPDRKMVFERVSGVTRESASPRVQTGSGRKPLSFAWHDPGGAGEPVVIAIEPAPGEVVELVGGEHPTNPRTTMTSRAGASAQGVGHQNGDQDEEGSDTQQSGEHADDRPEQEPGQPQRERENRGEGGKLGPTPPTSI
jgi:hypothetical protein